MRSWSLLLALAGCATPSGLARVSLEREPDAGQGLLTEGYPALAAARFLAIMDRPDEFDRSAYVTAERGLVTSAARLHDDWFIPDQLERRFSIKFARLGSEFYEALWLVSVALIRRGRIDEAKVFLAAIPEQLEG